MLTVGYLIPFIVIKALPDCDAYLTQLVNNSGILAQLPKDYALKNYKAGESGWASIFNIRGSRVTLSQKSAVFVRKICEHLLLPVIKSGEIKVKRVAKVSTGPFYKVAVESMNGWTDKDLLDNCLPLLENSVEYLQEKVILVKYSSDIEEFIVNALTPAPKDKVDTVILSSWEAEVLVDEQYAGMFFGPEGSNVATASKLTGYKIKILPL